MTKNQNEQLKVIIVDDELQSSSLSVEILKNEKFDVTCAINGKVALQLLKINKYDLIISDILMPVFDGFQLCRECKTNPALKNIPFVFYTAAYTKDEDKDFALSLGAERFILKSVDPAEFILIVRDVIHQNTINDVPVKEPEIKDEKYLAEHNKRLVDKLGNKILMLEEVNKINIESEKNLQIIIENNADSILIIDKEGIILFANKQAEAVFGKTNDEIIGSFFGNIDLQKDQPVDILGANNQIIFAEARSREIIWEHKNVYLTTLRDISSHVHLQQSLQESKNEIVRQRDLAQKYLNIAGVILLIRDLEGNVLHINKKGCETLGYPEKDIIGKNWFDHFIPEDIKNEIKNLYKTKVLKTENYNEYHENAVKTCNNKIKYIAWHNSVLKDEYNKIYQILSSGEDITEQKKALERIEYLATFPALNPNPIVEVDSLLSINYMNPGAKKIFPDLSDLKEKHPWLADMTEIIKNLKKNIQTIKYREVYVDEKWYQQVIDYVEKNNSYRIYGTDITERKQREERELLVKEVLLLLNKTNDVEYAVHNILMTIKNMTHLESLAIRLKEGDDFPYFETTGFPEKFVQSEKYLCARDKDGNIVRDCNNIPLFECMCGNVLCRRSDPLKPFFTEYGSYWSNNTTELLSTTTDADRMSHTRNRCNGSGYESVALIPLKTGEEIIGLLQLNDHRTDCFTLDMIHFFEGLGSSIGIAIARKRSKDDLKTSEEKFRSLLENSADAIFITDTAGKYVYTNKTVTNMLGFTQEEMLTKTITDLAPGYRINEYLEIFKNLKNKGKNSAEIELLKKDGSFLAADLNAIVLPDGLIYGSCRDISARKEVEQNLKNSEIRYRRLFEAAKDGIIILDAETGIIVDVNPYLLDLLGFSFEVFKGKTIWEIGFFKDIIANKDKFKELQDKKYIRYDDVPLETADGKIKEVEFVSNVYLAGNKEVIQCNIRDITEHNQYEKALIKSEIKYRGLYNSIRDAILVANTDRKIIECNQAFADLFEYSLSEIKNKETIYVYENEEQFNELGQALKRHSENNSPFLYTVNYKKKSGVIFPGETNIYYLHDDIGNIIGFIGLIRDISERKRTEKMLIESEKMIEIAHLSAGVAHEFNNILAIIKSASQLLLLEENLGNITFDERIKDELSIIDKQTKRGADIVSNLMLFSRPNKTEKEYILIEDIIDDVLKLQEKQFEMENIEIIKKYNNKEKLLLNPGQIQQVFLNLSINAIHALKRNGRGTIEIETYNESYNIIVTFSDNGIGMNNEVIQNIFKPFFTTKGASANDDLGLKGTGLGLSVSNSIIKEYNGSIDVESEENKGTRFIITIPLEVIQLEENKKNKVKELIPDNLFNKKANILIVDDEINIADNIAKILTAFGFENIDVYYSSTLALNSIKNKNYELFFIDINMPEIKGNVLINKIYSNEKTDKSNIIVMSGTYDDQIKKIVDLSSKYYFLKKPFSSDDIIKILNNIFKELR